MKVSNNSNALSHNQIAEAIATLGADMTVLVEGEMGIGKTTILKMLGKMFPSYTLIYCDCTTKDMGDLMVPMFDKIEYKDGRQVSVVRFALNEEFGMHVDGPCIVMLDEIGKANPSVKAAMTRFMLEGVMGNVAKHPDTIVFATTNLSAENVGDMLQGHQRNRIVPVRLRKPDNLEWIGWAIDNDVDTSILAWAKDTPEMFHSFEQYENPKENEYINHPHAKRAAFVTPRSLVTASKILKKRDVLDDVTIQAMLGGAIGTFAASKLMAYVTLSDQLPSIDSIKADPNSAKVPTAPGAIMMVVYRALLTIERDWVNSWMVYMDRLSQEAQAVFVNNARKEDYSRQATVANTKAFQDWCFANGYVFSKDK